MENYVSKKQNQDDVDKHLDQLFLGPKSEQRVFFNDVLQLISNDYIFWRRNFYPQDPPAIPYKNLKSEQSLEFQEDFMQGIFDLISELKLDIPFFSPRYMAHMVSETNLPAIFSYFATMLYNPNNVSSEASPVTLDYELQVGRDFANLFGYDDLISFGHLTSGGTVANYESLFYNKTMKFLPVGIGIGLKAKNIKWPSFYPKSIWQLMNIDYEVMESTLEQMEDYLLNNESSLNEILKEFSYAQLGERQFIKIAEKLFNESFPEYGVILPTTAHYSWSRSANLFSIGKQNYLKVEVDHNFRMLSDNYEEVLNKCIKNNFVVIQTIGVFGSTEFSNFDPIDEIVRIRDTYKKNGLFSPIHIDAAYGGYFPSMFKKGTKIPFSEEILDGPYSKLRRCSEALAYTESVTIDPHKMGFVPFGAGAIVFKHGSFKEFVAEKAEYVFSVKDKDGKLSDQFQLGKYILEGSKPGAVASAVYFSNKMIPLNFDGYGSLLFELCKIAKSFNKLLLEFNKVSTDWVFLPAGVPEANIQCFIAYHPSIKTIKQLNEVNNKLSSHFGVQKTLNIQTFEYLLSHTSVTTPCRMVDQHEILSKLEMNDNKLTLMRTVFMNRWVRKVQHDGRPFLEDVIDKMYLKLKEFI